MSLEKTIRADLKSAMLRKDNDTKDLLRVLLGELPRIVKKVGEDITDDDILKVIRKMSKDATEMENQSEVEILSVYLPTMLEPKQLETLIIGTITSNSYGKQDMGKVMGWLKSNYGGTYDGRLASEIVRNNL